MSYCLIRMGHTRTDDRIRHFLRLGLIVGLVALSVAAWPHAFYDRLAHDGVVDAPVRAYLRAISLLAALGAIAIALADRLPAPRLLRLVSFVLVASLTTELACAAALRILLGAFHISETWGAFTYHPILVGMPTPHYERGYGPYRVSHNSEGFRGPELSEMRWWTATMRVAAVGGSTTYDVGVPDSKTWTHLLDQRLGAQVAVLNMGVPGHSTAEHVIVTSLIASTYKPTHIVYYVGWNDIANSHVSTLTPDYANPHFYAQFAGLQVDWTLFSRSAALTVVKRLLASGGILKSPYMRRVLDGTPSQEVDPRVLALFERNIRLLIAATRSIGAIPIFIPQLLNMDRLSTVDRSEWLPYLPGKAVWPVMSHFNKHLISIVREQEADVVVDVLRYEWKPEDFVDSGHFSERGTRRFAEILARWFERRFSVSTVDGTSQSDNTSRNVNECLG